MYLKAYSYHIQPVQGMNQWPGNELNKPLPPIPRKMPGRPKKKRTRTVQELPSHTGKISKIGVAMTCEICLQERHNKRSSKRELIAKPPRSPKKVGRPKKDKSLAEGTSGNSMAVTFYILFNGRCLILHIFHFTGNSMAEGTSVQAGKGKGEVDGT